VRLFVSLHEGYSAWLRTVEIVIWDWTSIFEDVAWHRHLGEIVVVTDVKRRKDAWTSNWDNLRRQTCSIDMMS